MSQSTPTEDRALTLLGQGLSPEIVASAVGVSASRISQLISNPEFSAQVAELRFTNLAKHNIRDNLYDSLEDTLLDKLKDMIGWMTKPFEVLKAIQIINAAKRRGSSTPDSILNTQQVVQLIMPTILTETYSRENSSLPSQLTVNINNQVVTANGQNLITIQSARMNSLLEQSYESLPVKQNNQYENTISRDSLNSTKERALARA